jgi:hypothetical protein
MKRSPLAPIVAAAVLTGAITLGFPLLEPRGPSFVPPAWADSEGPGCTNASLRGRYGFKYDAVTINGDLHASVTLFEFDGNGRFTGRDVFNRNGAIIRRTIIGTYAVDRNCTGSLEFESVTTDPPHRPRGEFVIVDHGKEFLLVIDEPGEVGGGVGKKL